VEGRPPIYVTFAVARMLAVNGATFDNLVRAGLTPGQVDDALARLGKRVHRTTSDGSHDRSAGSSTSRLPATPAPAASGLDGRPTCHSSSKQNGSWRRAAASPDARSRNGLATRRSANVRCRTGSSPSPNRNSTCQRSGSNPDTVGYSGTELIRPADPTIFLTAAAAGYTDRTDDIVTANTLLRADMRNDDDAASLEEVRSRLQFLADTGYDLRHNLPD
jgi:hypothetical protein